MSGYLYKTRTGRMLLKLLTRPALSRAAGNVLDRRISRCFIGPFVRHYRIDLSEYPDRPYTSFNDFFTRTPLPGRRPITTEAEALVSPCDGLLSVYPIQPDTSVQVKGSLYTVGELLQDDTLADLYRGGFLISLRLTVSNYHRYCYPDDGLKEPNVRIPGILHTVRPIAHMHYKVFKTNSREYTLLHTEHHGDILQMEVGAMMVGRIVNEHPEARAFTRGEEKGHFEFGGSTVLLFVPKGVTLCHYTEDEIPVKMGEPIGYTKTGGSI